MKFIDKLIKRYEDKEITCSVAEVFFIRKGAPMTKDMENEVVAERFGNYLQNKSTLHFLTEEQALLQIVDLVKEEIDGGYSLYTDSLFVNFLDLSVLREKLEEIEKSETFHAWGNE